MDRFRGSAPARLDEKGRLKVPNLFRQQIEEAFGRDLFVTSIHGRNFLLYPLPVWRTLEEKLAELPAIHRAKNKFLERVNYYGQDSSIDGQGRVLIPQILRDAAKLSADVVVTGNIDHLSSPTAARSPRSSRPRTSDPRTTTSSRSCSCEA